MLKLASPGENKRANSKSDLQKRASAAQPTNQPAVRRRVTYLCDRIEHSVNANLITFAVFSRSRCINPWRATKTLGYANAPRHPPTTRRHLPSKHSMFAYELAICQTFYFLSHFSLADDILAHLTGGATSCVLLSLQITLSTQQIKSNIFHSLVSLHCRSDLDVLRYPAPRLPLIRRM